MVTHNSRTQRKILDTLAACAFLLAPAVAGAAVPSSPAALASVPAAAAKQVDALLAKWDKPGMPGAAVAVIHDGKIVYKRGVGMADIEREAPITPATPFHIASVSKQFTAFAIHLLAQDGKLTLDDDIRKHLPELHDFGKTITIRHLINHTSGLRDQWNLLAMGGWRLEDVITEEDIVRMIRRQRALNFEPGQEYAYSNTGYTLLALIVKRVSGQPLPAFARERMFRPLGMANTHFHDNYGTLVKGRALSYGRSTAGDFYEYVALSYSNVGATSLFTTVEDLALWDKNFDDGRVGGKDMLAEMQKPAMLASGKPAGYASGLVPGAYRGLPTIGHTGGDAGYRSILLRFPGQRLSIAVLANAGDFNTTRLAQQIADIYLGDKLKPLPPKKPAPVEVPVDPSRLDAFVGDFALSPEFVFTFTKENGQLMAQATGQSKFPVFASGERTFFYKVVDAQLTFDAPAPDGTIAGVVLHQNGRDQHAKRVARKLPGEAELKAFEGDFYSDELHVLYKVTSRNGRLVMSYPRGEAELDYVTPNVFAAGFPLGQIEFQCAPGEGCTSFAISNGRVRKLQFSKVRIEPVKPALTAQAALF